MPLTNRENSIEFEHMSYLSKAAEYLKARGVNPMTGVPTPSGGNIIPMHKAFPIAMFYANAFQAQDIPKEEEKEDFQI